MVYIQYTIITILYYAHSFSTDYRNDKMYTLKGRYDDTEYTRAERNVRGKKDLLPSIISI